MTDQKELPVATIEKIDHDAISLKIEVDGDEKIFEFKTTPKVNEFLGNPKYTKDYHKGVVVEYSAKGGVISLVRKAKGFMNIKLAPKEEPKTVPPEIVKTTQIPTSAQVITPSPQAVQFPPKETIGYFDTMKVHGYTVRDTCQMGAYEPLSIEVTADDPETARKALVDAWQIFGQHNEVIRETVQKHIERTLLRG